ncbi:MAG: copper ion binding protein [Chloroflexota bacterium]
MADKKDLKRASISISIGGMTCASCAANVETALKGVPGVDEVVVNLGTEKAMVQYDPAVVTLAAMKKAVDEVGYEAVLSTANLNVTGMTCASCVEHVQKAVTDLPGVVKAVVNLATNSAKVEYEPSITSLAEIRKAIKDIGYEATERTEGQEALDREQAARQRDVRRQLINLIVAGTLGMLVMIGMLQPYWFFSSFVPAWLNNKVVLFFLTTPVVFGPGRQFFINSWNGLRRGLTDMNLLYATGIGAAYGIAVVNTFWPNAGFGGKEATFYEAAALLTAFIILGRYLEAVTRGRTSQAIRRLMKLQPKKARVLRDGEEVEITAEEVQINDLLAMRPGEVIAVDGVVEEGYSSVDQSMITGESIPRGEEKGRRGHRRHH